MKAYSFENWVIDNTSRPFLFFIQGLEEMLFHYGHDSYKVPALNFHYLCIEILSTIEKIEEDVVDKGNMRPLIDELESMFLMDPIAQKLYGADFNSLFYQKNDKGDYSRDCSQLKKDPGNESSLKSIERTLSYFVEDMAIGDKYLENIKSEIMILLKAVSFDCEKQKQLSWLSRLLLTELINRGYRQEYIYSRIKEYYYNPEKNIGSIDEEIEQFWTLFSFEEHEYKISFPIKRADIKKLFEHLPNVTLEANTNCLFGNACKWIASMEMKELDPESAYYNASSVLSLFVSLKQYSSHVSKAYYFNQALVKDQGDEKIYMITKPSSLLSREKSRSEQQVYKRIGQIIRNFPVIGDKMINVINLHSSAMDSRNVSNQLLNLWTIVEVLVEVDKKNNFSKITQICNILTTVLNASYIKSLVDQLLFDLHHCCNELGPHLQNVTKGEDETEKMIALLVLPEYQQNKTNLIADLQNYPLLQYRIEHYAEQFSNRKELKGLLLRHRRRLEWQIMRIYRNRNMIVHDGSHFPYIDLVVQNLHFYVDTLIDTVNSFVSAGFSSLDTIYARLSRGEYESLIVLDAVDNNKQPLAIGDDFANIILGKNYIRN